MSTRPVIFISAVSKELRSARGLAARLVHSLGYDPKDQDMARTEHGQLKDVLQRWIDQSAGVIQLVGKCYGAEPSAPDAEFGRVSYTQFEARYALSQGKPVWYFFVGYDYPADAYETEPEALRALQSAYADSIRLEGDLRHRFTNDAELENAIHRIDDHLDELRHDWKQEQRRVRRFRILASVALLILIGLGATGLQLGWWVKQSTDAVKQDTEKTREIVVQTEKKVDSVLQRYKQMEQALIKLADAEMHAKQFGEKLTPEQLRQRAYTILENELGIAAGTLSKELPGFALELYNRPDTTLLMRARAAYALNKFEEAEKLFLQSDAQDKKAMENAEKVASDLRGQRIEALVGAGQSARAQIHYLQAMDHHLAATALISQERDVLRWLNLQNSISYLYYLQGRYGEGLAQTKQVWQTAQQVGHDEAPDVLDAHVHYALALNANGHAAAAEPEFRTVIQVQERVLGVEHSDTLISRGILAIALYAQAKNAEAEQEYRTVFKLIERVLGAEHPQTLTCRSNLASALYAQAKYVEAEQELRAVLNIGERVLGAEHPDTLSSRGNLAAALQAQGKYAEVEQEYRAVLKVQERVLGAEHPATLSSRMNLASALGDQGKYAKAEQECRAVLKVQERVLGAEHPQTLTCRSNLAIALDAQGKQTEAEQEDRAVLKIKERVLGAGHPDTLKSRMNLAVVLQNQGKNAEAEQEHRAVLRIKERVLGAEHPDTLASRGNLATLLDDQGSHAEAEQECRAVLKIRERVQGAEHPDVAKSCCNLALCLEAQKKLPEALVFMRRAEQVWTKALGPDHPNTKDAKTVRERLEAAVKGK